MKKSLFFLSCFCGFILFAQSKADTLFFSSDSLEEGTAFQQERISREQLKFRAFQKKLDSSTLQKEAYAKDIRTFIKDSLQILEVKLLSVQELDRKKLLQLDIVQNARYYQELLQELKSSEIDPSEYLFLENKLTIFLLNDQQKKYRISQGIIVFLAVLIFGLIFYIYKTKRTKKEHKVIPLSKQEITIKDFILEGKTNKEIAEALFISLSTVKTHITHIYKKLQVTNRSELLEKLKNSTGTST